MNIPGAMPIPTDEAIAIALADVFAQKGIAFSKFTAAEQASAVTTFKDALGIEE